MPASIPLSKKVNAVASVLVLGVFLVAGLAVFFGSFLRPVCLVISARKWTATQCQVVACDVREIGRKAGIAIRYRYTVDGRDYESARFDFSGATIYQGKEIASYSIGTEATCYVNPRKPSEAVIQRHLTKHIFGGLLSLFFIFIGGGGILFVLHNLRQTSRRVSMMAGEAPWLFRNDWAAGFVRPTIHPNTYVFSLVALLCISITLPLLQIIPGELARKGGDRLILVSLVFPVMDLILTVLALHRILRWLKFRRTRFAMVKVPACPGQQLQGTVRLGREIRPEHGCQIHLRCLHRVVTGSGKQRSVIETILWESQQEMADGVLRDIPVLFNIPADALETNYTNARDEIVWRLDTKAKLRGFDMDLAFDVPVFKQPRPAKS